MKPKVVTEYITLALLELLKTKELKDITTSELINKAGVCRSSYYRNFYEIEDILRQYIDKIVIDLSNTPEIKQSNLHDHIKNTFQIFYKERDFLTIIMQRNLLYLLDNPIYDLCIQQSRQLNLFDNEYQAAFYAGSTMYVLKTWIKREFKETPTELADITYKYINKDTLS